MSYDPLFGLTKVLMQKRAANKQRMVRDHSGKVYVYVKDGSLRRLIPKPIKNKGKKKVVKHESIS